jgi:class 3 adenylate cyclase
MDPESARRSMDRLFALLREAVFEHGGRVVKYTGDGLMAVFGIPEVAEDDAVRAVRCAAAMQSSFAALAGEIKHERGTSVALRVGVNTGEVVVPEATDDVVGDAVNVANRLEHAAEESGVLVGEETWRLARDAVTFAPMSALHLRGRADPIRAFELVSLEPPEPVPSPGDRPNCVCCTRHSTTRSPIGPCVS